MSKDLSNQRLFDLMNERFNRFEDSIGERFQRMEERTSILERFNSDLTGKIAVLWFISTAALALGIDFVRERIFGKP